LIGKPPPKQLEGINLPYCLSYLWGWFCELSGGRDYSQAGPLPLKYSEIESWANLLKIDPSIWEVQIIKAIDRVFITEVGKK